MEEFVTDEPSLLTAVDDIVNSAKEGIRLQDAGVFTASLKDELRPFAKVEAGKTRVFTACSLDLLLAIRRYFSGFTNHVCEDRIVNEICLGINVYDMDWTRLATHLHSKGDNIIAGDFSNFDGSLNSQILKRIVSVINSWYNDGEENALVREVLFEYLTSSCVLIGNDIVQLNHSQPSGNPLTTVINCMYNAFIFRYVWLVIREERNYPTTLVDFNYNVAMAFYGDDSIISVSDNALEWFNQITITQAMASTGHIYTDETKSTAVTECKKLSECTFLKRGFVYDAGVWLCPLAWDTVENMVMWFRNDMGPFEALEATLSSGAKEAAFHGEQKYNYWATTIRNFAVANALRTRIYIPTYAEQALLAIDARTCLEAVEVAL
jgi:hypothetical protein